MNAADVGAWHVIGLGLINESIVQILGGALEQSPLHTKVRGGHGHRCLVGYCAACTRGGCLGRRLPPSPRATRLQVCNALFAQRTDKLWPRERFSGKSSGN